MNHKIQVNSANLTPLRADIQRLRALSVLAVMAFNANLTLRGGLLGVDVFFVISGFLITSMIYRNSWRTETFQFRYFNLNRFKRLVPGLALMVFVTLILAVFVLSPFGPQQNTALTGVGAMTIAANAVIARVSGGYFSESASSNPLLHTWSLSVEEQFYIFSNILSFLWHYLPPTLENSVCTII